jgi:FkbM family methyltransferase
MAVWFDNWRQIRRHQRAGIAIPPLNIRGRFTLLHRPEDAPLFQVAEVLGAKCYRRYIREPKEGTVIDIGANIGVVTLDWATRLPGLRIHAYEPNPQTYAVFLKNIEAQQLRDRVIAYQQAVGRRSFGRVVLHGGRDSVLSSHYYRGDAISSTFEVETISLDEVIRRCGTCNPDLVKIDTEGAEADILEGASILTLRRVRQFVLEYHNSLVPGALARCREVLTGAGFDCIVRPGPFDKQGLLYARQVDPNSCGFGNRRADLGEVV